MKACFVCKKSEKVIDFNNESFNKCCDVLKIRKENKFKYGNIVLLSEAKDCYGYHIECYRKVMTLKSKYKSNEDNKNSNVSIIINILNEVQGCF